MSFREACPRPQTDPRSRPYLQVIDERLPQVGAERFHVTAFADDGTGLELEVEPWKEGLFAKLEEIRAGSGPPARPTVPFRSGRSGPWWDTPSQAGSRPSLCTSVWGSWSGFFGGGSLALSKGCRNFLR